MKLEEDCQPIAQLPVLGMRLAGPRRKGARTLACGRPPTALGRPSGNVALCNNPTRENDPNDPAHFGRPDSIRRVCFVDAPYTASGGRHHNPASLNIRNEATPASVTRRTNAASPLACKRRTSCPS
jgi:hypothetical protein